MSRKCRVAAGSMTGFLAMVATFAVQAPFAAHAQVAAPSPNVVVAKGKVPIGTTTMVSVVTKTKFDVLIISEVCRNQLNPLRQGAAQFRYREDMARNALRSAGSSYYYLDQQGVQSPRYNVGDDCMTNVFAVKAAKDLGEKSRWTFVGQAPWQVVAPQR